MLRRIEIELGGSLKIQSFFDLVVGTRCAILSASFFPFRCAAYCTNKWATKAPVVSLL